jgi:16S rRNA (uracil1498-N3)-methyltransferase
VAAPLRAPGRLALDERAARHAQVLRLQPGDALTLFDGRGGEWAARVDAMTRRGVDVTLLEHHPIERELARRVTLALAMPAGDRMDVVVEKATELGVAALQPLVGARSVLRLAGERATRRRDHWQAIALAACEQSGRNRIPQVASPQPLADWLAALEDAPADGERRWLLGWHDARPWPAAAEIRHVRTITTLSGPEGGLTADEESLAAARGFVTISLGTRVLRADTAPLAVLAALALPEPPTA